jgi:hypothetical protein
MEHAWIFDDKNTITYQKSNGGGLKKAVETYGQVKLYQGFCEKLKLCKKRRGYIIRACVHGKEQKNKLFWRQYNVSSKKFQVDGDNHGMRTFSGGRMYDG